jgi:hypothetical protein
MSNSNQFLPPKDKYLALHEAMMAEFDSEPDEATVTAELRALGPLLENVSPEQRSQLDQIAAMQPAKRKKRRK